MTRIATTHRRRTRPGFTLVELLVSMALILVIMAILANCFQSGIDTLRQLRSQGDMTDQLRAFEIVVRRDLQAKRFLPEDDKENLGVRLSDLRYDQLVPNPPGGIQPAGTQVVTALGFGYNTRPPRGGFMRIKSADLSAGTGSFFEGIDPDGLVVTRATDHYLHFTSVLQGGTDQNVYGATVAGIVPPTPQNPTGQVLYTSPAAEIALFLDTGSGPIGFAGSVPLYNLVRRQRLVAIGETDAFGYPAIDAGVISVSLFTGRVNTMADLTDPNNRLCGPGQINGVLQPNHIPNGGIFNCAPQPMGNDGYLAPLGGNRIGDDVLLSNVISFEVKVNWDPATYGFVPVGVPRTPATAALPPWIGPQAYPGILAPSNDNDNDMVRDSNTDYPFDWLPGRFAGIPTGTNNLTGGFNDYLNRSVRLVPGQSVPVLANGRYVYDSWTMRYPNWNTSAMVGLSPVPHPEAIPMRARVKSIQIRVRVFDPKLKNARQMTIIQDL
jgi:prepilin-type N-terminal cleavage/methylation domain-containing protein